MTQLLPLLLVAAQTLSGGGAERESGQRPAAERLLCTGTVGRVDLSPYGGLSVKFLLRLGPGPGRTAVFKPEQPLYSARFEAEIAAFRLATHLGVTAVPAACERRIRHERLLALTGDPRHAVLRARLERELRPDPEGWVRGAAIAWVPLVKELPATERLQWARWLTPGAPVPVAERSRLGEVADLLLLDLLFGNPDRFTGGNLLVDRATGRLLMIDNGASFRPVATLDRPYHPEQLALLRRVRSGTYQRVRRLDRPTLLSLVRRPAAQGSYLTYPEVRALLKRRDALVRHVEALRRAHGDGAVLLP